MAKLSFSTTEFLCTTTESIDAAASPAASTIYQPTVPAQRVLVHDLDHYFYEHLCKAFRSYQQGMSAIISAYLGCDQNYGPRKSLVVEAQRMHDSSPSERSMAVAYVLASENFESFLALMRRLDKPLRYASTVQVLSLSI